MQELSEAPNIKIQPPLSPEAVKTPVSKCFYLVQIIFVCVALGIYVGIYFINNIESGYGILSFYYSDKSPVISSVVVGAQVVPQPEANAGNVIKTIVFNWIMWKAANILVILDMLSPFIWQRKLIGISVFSVIMCALDWVIFVLLNDRAYDYAFIGISWAVSFVLCIALYANQGKQPFHVTLRNSLFPYLSYVTLVVVYWFALPNLFNVLVKNINGINGTLTFFYLFPIIDTLLVLFNWLMQYGVSDQMKQFVSVTTNWLLQGYRVGILCRLSFSQADLYYQIAWIMFRNILFNWIINKPHLNRVNLSMPGWIMAFYISVFLNFLPVCGISNITTSKYYNASISMFFPYLLPKNVYFANQLSVQTPFNPTLRGNIQWYVPLVIWVVETVTQKYRLYEFNWKLVVYNMIGIYLFYVGLISGLGIYELYYYRF